MGMGVVNRIVILPSTTATKIIKWQIIEKRTRSILPPCPVHGMWGCRKASKNLLY